MQGPCRHAVIADRQGLCLLSSQLSLPRRIAFCSWWCEQQSAALTQKFAFFGAIQQLTYLYLRKTYGAQARKLRKVGENLLQTSDLWLWLSTMSSLATWSRGNSRESCKWVPMRCRRQLHGVRPLQPSRQQAAEHTESSRQTKVCQPEAEEFSGWTPGTSLSASVVWIWSKTSRQEKACMTSAIPAPPEGHSTVSDTACLAAAGFGISLLFVGSFEKHRIIRAFATCRKAPAEKTTCTTLMYTLCH